MDTLSPSCVIDTSASSESSESHVNSDTQSSETSHFTSAITGGEITRPLSFEHVDTQSTSDTQPMSDVHPDPPSMPDVLV